MEVKTTLDNMKNKLDMMSEIIGKAYKHNARYMKAYAEFSEKDNFLQSIINKPGYSYDEVKAVADERNAKAKEVQAVGDELITENMPLSLDFNEMAETLQDIFNKWCEKSHPENMDNYFAEIESDISDIIDDLYIDTDIIIDEILTASEEIISVIDDIV